MKTKMGRSTAKCFIVVVVDHICGCSLERLFASEMERRVDGQEAKGGKEIYTSVESHE